MSSTGAGWPQWADTPAKRERNAASWRAHNERVSAPEREQLRLTVRFGRFARTFPLPVYRTVRAS